jgi:hypothetical protein
MMGVRGRRFPCMVRQLVLSTTGVASFLLNWLIDANNIIGQSDMSFAVFSLNNIDRPRERARATPVCLDPRSPSNGPPPAYSIVLALPRLLQWCICWVPRSSRKYHPSPEPGRKAGPRKLKSISIRLSVYASLVSCSNWNIVSPYPRILPAIGGFIYPMYKRTFGPSSWTGWTRLDIEIRHHH